MPKAVKDSAFKPLKFSKKSRLLVKSDFQPVFDNAKKVTSSFLIALYHPNSLNCPRLGIILSKQRVRRAVDRNMIRRVIREYFRQMASELQAIDIIIMIRGGERAWNRQEVRQVVGGLLSKLKSDI